MMNVNTLLLAIGSQRRNGGAPITGRANGPNSHLLSLALLLFAMSLGAFGVASAETKPLKMVLMGDSFSSGTGARTSSGKEDFVLPEGCYRSPSNWSEKYREKLQELGLFEVTLLNRACWGAVIEDLNSKRLIPDTDKPRYVEFQGNRMVGGLLDSSAEQEIKQKYCTVEDPNADYSYEDLKILSAKERAVCFGSPPMCVTYTAVDFSCGILLNPQSDSVGKDTDVVLMTIGGNNAGFSKIVEQCFAPGPRDAAGCRAAVTEAYDQLIPIRSKTVSALMDLRQNHLREDARVVLLSYPFLALEANNELTLNEREFGFVVDSYRPAFEVRELQRLADEFQRMAVDDANNQAGTDFAIYVDSVKQYFAGHEPDAQADTRNPSRWLWELNEPHIWPRTAEWYHPNPQGHEALADLLSLLNTQSTFPSTAAALGDIDIAFVVDTTGSMGDDIASVQAFAVQLIEGISAATSSFRIALVTYRDFASRTGVSTDYASRVDLEFTDRADDAVSAINAMSLGYGGDTPETVFSGLNTAIDLKWRPGVKKVIIQLGDAPPLNPEPVTNLTPANIIEASLAVDPVEVYVVATSSSGTPDPILAYVAAETGGTVVSAANPSQVAAALTETIVSALEKPFAWANGPYIVRAGDQLELNASGSYAAEGTIVRYEWDVDNDGIFDLVDTAQRSPYVYASDYRGRIVLRITDDRGRISLATTFADASVDGDGVPTEVDNCPMVANHGQSDDDGDGIGDACDSDAGVPQTDRPGVFEGGPDADGDGISDDADACPETPSRTLVDAKGCPLAQKVKICSFLGNDPKPSLLDQDIFEFQGRAGDAISITLEKDASGTSSGDRAALILKQKAKLAILKLDRSDLPNQVDPALPRTGTYQVIVGEEPKILRGKQFRGNYCLSLDGPPGALETFKPTAWVE